MTPGITSSVNGRLETAAPRLLVGCTRRREFVLGLWIEFPLRRQSAAREASITSKSGLPHATTEASYLMALEYRNGRPRYYRYERTGDRVRKVYVACGDLALIAAERDAQRRNELLAERQRIDQQQRRITDFRAPLESLNAALDTLHAALLLSAGYYCPDYGRWRLRHDRAG